MTSDSLGQGARAAEHASDTQMIAFRHRIGLQMSATGEGQTGSHIEPGVRTSARRGPSTWLAGVPETRWALPLLLAVYVVVATLYAVSTPAWQAPDEPAHYNYVRFLAEQHRFPVLKLGDYPAAYLEDLKAARFPLEMSIAPVRYEFHQPPLYYMLAVPIYRLFCGDLVALRMLSVALGGLLLIIVHGVVQVLAPDRPGLALGAAAFVGFLPMHVTMMSSVNNDALAELLLAIVLLLSLRYLALPASQSAEPHPGLLQTTHDRILVLLGITSGLGLLTKTSVYIAVPLVLLAIAARTLRQAASQLARARPGRSVILYLVSAVGLGLPWWLRNLVVYGAGNLNFLGLGRHEQVVVGQLRTAEFVAENGFGRLVSDFFLTSFRSFWGQFGWMGVMLDQRLYQALAILSALAILGFVAWLARVWQQSAQYPRWKREGGVLLAVSGSLTAASYVWYNAGFLQHQGRYLFPALVPIGLAAALGWREVLQRRWNLHLIALASALAFVALGLRLAGMPVTWPLLMLVTLIAALVVRRLISSHWDPFVHTLPYLLLIPLDLVCLYLFIAPQLAA